MAEYGNAASYFIFKSPIVLLNEPELVREVLVTKARSFVKERSQQRMKILLGEGLITSDGDFHMRQRRIAAPAFYKQRISAYADVMTAQALDVGARWRDGETLDIAAEMMRLSLQVVAQTLFATEVNADVLSVVDVVNSVMGLYNLLLALPRAELYLHMPLPGLRKFQKSKAHLDAVMARIIHARRESDEDRGDLLSMLIAARDTEGSHAGMTDSQLRDEVVTIFLAGYETIANAMTWTWALLAQNPDVETRLHAELDSALGGRVPTLEDLPQLKYVEGVLAESMRIFPPVWAMGRMAAEDVEIGPYRLPRGTFVYMSQYLLHRDARFWPEPLRFDPSRFAAGRTTAQFTYFPFGAGARQCIGESFAWMEGTLLLATLAQKWRLRVVPGQTLAVQPKITLRPKGAVRMTIEAR